MKGRFGPDVAMAFEGTDEDIDAAAPGPPPTVVDRSVPRYELGGSVPISRPGQPQPTVWADEPSAGVIPDTSSSAVPGRDDPIVPGGWLSPNPSPTPPPADSWAVGGLPPIPPVTGQPWQEDAVVSSYMQTLGEGEVDVWTGEGWRENESGEIAWSEPIPLEPDRLAPTPKRRRNGWLGGFRQRPEDVDGDLGDSTQLAAPSPDAPPRRGPDGSASWGAPPEELFGDDPSPTTFQMSAAAASTPDSPVREFTMIDPWLDPASTRPVSGRWRDPELEQEPHTDPVSGLRRICETCRSFRSQQNGRGACTHPFAFPHTRVVTGTSLACSSSMGSWWSPSDRIWKDLAAIDRHSKPTPLLDELLNPESHVDDDR